tara:strand:- start:734 stop:994 length:261 start_codon:yes stop_codon:yes gene_type:complete
MTVDDPAVNAAVTVTPAASKNPPPAVPPVAVVVIVAQVKLTLIVIDVLPLQTRTSDAPRLAHVNHEPEPFAALFHWLTESILTDEF